MTEPDPQHAPPAFDAYAARYEEMHNRHLPRGVESRDFLEQKVARVNQLVSRYFRGRRGLNVMDFGCGTGRLLSRIADAPWCGSVAGVDVSRASLAEAAQCVKPGNGACYWGTTCDELPASVEFEVIGLLNVAHHLAPDKRADAFRSLRKRLSPDGKVLIWEHNPLNPLTRRLVSSCPFDEDASLLTFRETRSLLGPCGLRLLEGGYVNVVPPRWHSLVPFRQLERWLRNVPLGAQYFVIAGGALDDGDQTS